MLQHLHNESQTGCQWMLDICVLTITVLLSLLGRCNPLCLGISHSLRCCKVVSGGSRQSKELRRLFLPCLFGREDHDLILSLLFIMLHHCIETYKLQGRTVCFMIGFPISFCTLFNDKRRLKRALESLQPSLKPAEVAGRAVAATPQPCCAQRSCE